MKTLVVKEEYIKTTGSFIGGIILNYLVDLKEENKLSNNFNINLQALKEVTMLDVSEATLRREIKKLIKLEFIIVEKEKKTHSYTINEEQLKKAFIKIGATEELESFIQNDELVNKDGIYKQMDIMNIKKVRECNHEQKCTNLHNNYIKNNKESQDKYKKSQEIEHIENYLKEKLNYEYLVIKNKDKFKADLFDKVYRIILEVVTNNAKTIRINGNNVSADIVRSVFKKLNYEVIESVIFKLQRLNNKVNNFKNYIITTTYNTYLEDTFQMQNNLYMNYRIIC